jgi:hypothetical protein
MKTKQRKRSKIISNAEPIGMYINDAKPFHVEVKPVSLTRMISCVEHYITIRKGVKVDIHISLVTLANHTKFDDDQPDLNRLGLAYDYAMNWMRNNGYNVRHYE